LRADHHRRLDLLYEIRDPWNMDSDRERFRFAETSRVIRQALIAPAPRARAILEIGCGEGHQSEYLAPLCERLTGIDISPTAIARAGRRLPSAEFVAGDLRRQLWATERDRFDIVTACEVLYFVQDVARVLATMSNLGRSCVVTYFVPLAADVEPFLEAVPIGGRESFRFGDTEWRLAWWRNAR
jgi:trans-aconitate methyltransferase